jgi:hypothetical protein
MGKTKFHGCGGLVAGFKCQFLMIVESLTFFSFSQVPKFHYRLAENTFVAEACHCHLGCDFFVCRMCAD